MYRFSAKQNQFLRHGMVGDAMKASRLTNPARCQLIRSDNYVPAVVIDQPPMHRNTTNVQPPSSKVVHPKINLDLLARLKRWQAYAYYSAPCALQSKAITHQGMDTLST